MKMNIENQVAALMNCLTVQSINRLLLYAYYVPSTLISDVMKPKKYNT